VVGLAEKSRVGFGGFTFGTVRFTLVGVVAGADWTCEGGGSAWPNARKALPQNRVRGITCFMLNRV
jgi:hypothetical protein